VTETDDESIQQPLNKQIEKTTIINRDLNGALNIRSKGMMVIMNKEIPDYLLRQKKKEDLDKKKVRVFRRTLSVEGNLIVLKGAKSD